MPNLKCPKCGRVETDSTARYCDVDGEKLVLVKDGSNVKRGIGQNIPATIFVLFGLLALGIAAFILFRSDESEESGTGSVGNGSHVVYDEIDQSLPAHERILKRCFKNVPDLPDTLGSGESEVLARGKELVQLGTDIAMQSGTPQLKEEDSRKFADELSEEIHQSYKRSSNREHVERVARISSRIGKVAAAEGLKVCSFEVLESEDVNAFMGPDRRGYVFSGLLDGLKSDDELGFIIGHEVAHSILKHIDRPLRSVLAGREVGRELIGGPLGEQIGDLAGSVVARLMDVTYSQDQEYEADRLGFCLAYLAGFDPNGASNSMSALVSADELRPPSKGPARLAYDLLTTHPPTDERRAYLRSLVPQLRTRGGTR